MKSRDTRKMMRVSIAVFFISLTFITMIFTLDILTTDWNTISEDFKDITSELSEIAKCEITIIEEDYEYAYYGLCDQQYVGWELLERIKDENKESLCNESNQ